MKYALTVLLGLSLAGTAPVFAAAPASTANTAALAPARVQAVQDLLRAMQSEKVLRSVAGRSQYANDAQRQAVYAKLDRVQPAQVYQRMAPLVAPAISAETATEMTRFYETPYGKQVIHARYNSTAQIMMPGMRTMVAPEEKKERQRAAYVKASKELADAQPAIDHAAFQVLQQINKEQH